MLANLTKTRPYALKTDSKTARQTNRQTDNSTATKLEGRYCGGSPERKQAGMTPFGVTEDPPKENNGHL